MATSVAKRGKGRPGQMTDNLCSKCPEKGRQRVTNKHGALLCHACLTAYWKASENYNRRGTCNGKNCTKLKPCAICSFNSKWAPLGLLPLDTSKETFDKEA
ncbi:unnamed protein product, partial [Mesorhabditis spiculigera]